MKQKHANTRSIEDSGAMRPETMLAAPREDVKDYIKTLDLSKFIDSDEDSKLYKTFKTHLIDSIEPVALKNFIFLALIERIAITGVLLNKLDKKLMEMDWPTTTFGIKGAKSEYIILQTEHRKCLEVFANLRLAEKHKKGKRVLEELRRTITDE